MVRATRVALVLLLTTCAKKLPPEGYRLDDPEADHDWIAKELAAMNRLGEAIQSFKSAARYSADSISFANLGVAFMRNQEFGMAWQALTRAVNADPQDQNAKDNLEVLYMYASEHGHSRKKLQTLGKNALLDISSPEQPVIGNIKQVRSRVTHDSGDMRRLLDTPEDIANRAQELFDRGEKKLGRGFLSLALHINPWLGSTLAWVREYIENEQPDNMTYWKGNLFVGFDKTLLEHVANVDFQGVREPRIYELGIYVWRSLEMVKHTCCGIDNVAVFLSRIKKIGHQQLVPFLHLTPEYIPQLKEANREMYASFREWWDKSGIKAPPTPRIHFDGNETWEWQSLKVVMPADRVPEGWESFTQATLLYRLQKFEAARSYLLHALAKNMDLSVITEEFMPGFESLVAPAHFAAHPASKEKYIVCYSPSVGLGNIAVVLVSAFNLARLTARTLLIHWNANEVSRHGWEFLRTPRVKLLGDAPPEVYDATSNVKSVLLFHTMESTLMARTLELLGCANLPKTLDPHDIVTVSSNLYFSPILRTNPYTKRADDVLEFHQGLLSLMTPSKKAKNRALSYAKKTHWAKTAPVIAIHIRSREAGEDNDDWPVADSPEQDMIESLWKCVEKAVHLEFGDVKEWDAFIASTTEKARKAAGDALKQNARGLRRLMMLPKVDRNRKTGSGAVDAMAEALLIARADVFVRLVVGTSGFSTFAYLANALRWHTQWAESLPPLRNNGFAPNYIVTSECDEDHRCFEAPPEVRMAEISWHGEAVTKRSCGDVTKKMNQKAHCAALKAAGVQEEEEEL
eukprot:TRINITY_DN42424_c0_g1_i1.p1 TRINITY_DN42424_c0_g1~~TRINITY_DN42424_c0_g1_i1.p1  ORF type:complete len:800 (+),score=143.88 TRINITY_DN42424_c0_g1_i1:107-2506(+)